MTVDRSGRYMERELNILLLVASSEDTGLIQKELTRSEIVARLVEVDNKEDYISTLGILSPDIVIADYNLDTLEGCFTLSTLKASNPYTPLIFVAGNLPDEKIMELLKEGATDFINKERLGKLGPSLRRAAREVKEKFQLLSAEKTLNQRLAQQAAVAELGQIALGGGEIQYLLEKAVEMVYTTQEVDFVNISKLLPGYKFLKVVAGEGWPGGIEHHKLINAEEGSRSSYVLKTNMPLIVEDLDTEARFTVVPFLKDLGIKSGVTVHIKGNGHPFGLLSTHSKKHRQFSEDDISFLQSISNVLAAAIAKKTTENALLRSESRFAKAFLLNPAPMTISDLGDGTLHDMNQAFLELFQYSREEVIGKRTTEMDFWVDKDQRNEIIRKVVEEKSLINEEIRIYTKQGKILDILASVELIDLNEKDCLLTCYRDITEGKKIYAQIKFHADILQNVYDAVIAMDNYGNINYWNSSAAEIFGYTEEEVTGLGLQKLLIGDNNASPIDFEDIISDGSYFNDWTFHKKDGSEVWVSLRLSPLLDDRGLTIGILAVAKDITSSVVAERQWHESESKFRTIIELSSDGLTLLDKDGIIIYSSPASLRLLEFPPEEIIGRHSLEFIHEDDLTLVSSILTKLQEEPGQSIGLEFRMIHKDGNVVWVEGTGTNLLNESGVNAIVCNLRNITHRKRLEEEKSRFVEILEATTDFVCLTDGQGKNLFLNTSGRLMIGLQEGHEIGRSLLELFPEWSRNLIRAQGFPVSFSKGSWSAELAILDSENNEIPVSVVMLSHKRIQGDVEYYSLMARDISVQKKAIADLRHSEERYRYLFERNPLALLIYDYQSLSIMDVNQAAVELYGFSREEFCEMTMTELRTGKSLHKPEENGFRELGLKTIMPNLKKDGRVIFLEIKTHAIVINGKEARIALVNDITERKKAEDAIIKSEANLTALIENTSDAVWAVDSLGIVQTINSVYKDLYKNIHSTELKEGLTLFGGLSSESAEISRINLDRVLAGERITFERKYHIDGKLRYFEETANPILTQGIISGAVFFSRDITERKKAERALMSSEERYRLMFENSPLPMWVWDNDSLTFLAVNEATLEHYGYTRDEFLKMSVKDIRPSELRMDFINGVRTSKQSSLGAHGIWKHVKKDGTLIDVEITSHLLEFNGKMARLVLANDVTERIRAEEALYQSEKRYRLISENMRDLICLHDGEGCYTYISPSIKEMLGYEPEELLGTFPYLLIFPDDMERVLMENALSQTERKDGLTDYRIRSKNGDYLWVETLIRPIFDENGQIVQFQSSTRDISERIKAQEALLRNEANLRALIDNTTDAIWSVNKDFKVEIINSSYKVLYQATNGFSLDKGMDIFEHVRSENRTSAIANFNSVLDGGNLRYERKYIVNGEVKYYDVNVNPIISPEGITGAAYFSRDITERKFAEESIRRSEHRYRNLIQTMTEGVFYIDVNNQLQFANDRFYEMTGYTEEELHGNLNYEKMLSRDYNDLIRFKSDMRQNLVSDQYELPLIRKSGELIWVLINGAPLIDEDGAILGSLCTVMDITERKESEENIRQSEEKYRKLIETMNEGVMYVDNADVVRFSNRRFCEMTGYSNEELVNQMTFQEMLDPRDAALLQEKMKLRQMGMGDQYEVQLRRKSGEYIWTMVNGIPLMDEFGLVIGSMGTFTDITELKKTESRLKATNQELNTFVYKSSHDLKGPLSSIMGLTNLAMNEVTDEESGRYIELIRQSANRLDSILSDLLETVRIKENAITLSLINFPPMINEILSSLGHTKGFERMRISLDINVEQEFISDRKILNSVLQNMIDNAIKYMDNEKVGSYLNLSIRDQGFGVKIEIEDNGLGIPATIQDKVFDMFYRGHLDSKGTGLGLYIVKNAVEKLGGIVRLASTEGKGTTFTILLPGLYGPE